jgi:hypothetical protein
MVQSSLLKLLCSDNQPIPILGSDGKDVHGFLLFINVVENPEQALRPESEFPCRIERSWDVEWLSIASWNIGRILELLLNRFPNQRMVLRFYGLYVFDSFRSENEFKLWSASH